MTEQQYGEHGQCDATAKSTGERCKKPAIGAHGKCDVHGGKSKSGPENGNFRHGAFSKHFTSHLTDTEFDAFEEARELLENPEGAQDVARTAAASCLMKFKRTGDERFLRRFEGLCDKFGIAPEDELTVNMPGVEEAILEDVRRHHEES